MLQIFAPATLENSSRNSTSRIAVKEAAFNFVALSSPPIPRLGTAEVLPKLPDIVLLDNMSLDELRAAVARRNAGFAQVQLEASGGVTLETVASIAQTGVDRISVGALTHSAVCLDIGLDWD